MNRYFSSLVLIISLLACQPLRAADLSITAANVVPSSKAVIRYATAGATVTAGQLVFLDPLAPDANGLGRAKPSDCNDVGEARVRVVDGIAINSAFTGQQVAVVTYDPALVIAASGLTPNQILISSATPGGIAPSADLTTGWYLTVIGIVKNGTTIFFRAPGLINSTAS